jgi:hypothetical protein
MNTIKQLLIITGSAFIITSCQEANKEGEVKTDSVVNEQPAVDNTPVNNTKYVDLKTGQPVDLYYSEKKKRTYSANTDEPVDLYVNVATGDTIYGQGRYVVNNYVTKTTEGTYKLDDSKIKIHGDEIKIKEGDKKLKIEDGEMKIKEGDKKLKVEGDEAKMKTDEMKEKTEDGKTKTKKE